MLAFRFSAAALVSSVACAYQPNSFDSLVQDFPGARRTLGCLDVAVELARDPAADGPVLGYTFGNRCDRATVVDLSAVRVTGSGPATGPIVLQPYDPDRELRPLMIEARSVGREQIEYRDTRARSLVHAVCADVGRINGQAAQEPICFESGGPGAES